jgi:hypothetical protein
MKLVYKCLHCGLAKESERESSQSIYATLGDAYRSDLPDAHKMHRGIAPYTPHECDPGVIGVAMLVAVKQ